MSKELSILHASSWSQLSSIHLSMLSLLIPYDNATLSSNMSSMCVGTRAIRVCRFFSLETYQLHSIYYSFILSSRTSLNASYPITNSNSLIRLWIFTLNVLIWVENGVSSIWIYMLGAWIHGNGNVDSRATNSSTKKDRIKFNEILDQWQSSVKDREWWREKRLCERNN